MDVFLPKIKQNIRLNRVYLLFKYSQESINICSKDNKRWQCAWNYLEEKLTKKFKKFFKLKAEELDTCLI